MRSLRAAGPLILALLSAAPSRPAPAPPPPLLIGLFLGRPEEGARLFTPVRLFPPEDRRSGGHAFPTLQRLRRHELEMLVWLGRAAGLGLRATLERYPAQPASDWPWPDYRPPPDTAGLRQAAILRRAPEAAPLPGLRAVLYSDGRPLAFIVDTRGLTLAQRGMRGATTMGLDISRDAFLAGLGRAAAGVPDSGLAAVLYQPAGESLAARYAGAYDSGLLELPVVRARLDSLAGARLEELLQDLDVTGSVDLVSGWLSVSGNAAHAGGEREAVVCVNPRDSTVAAAIHAGGTITILGATDYQAVPQCVRDWITDVNAGHAARLARPDNVQLAPEE